MTVEAESASGPRRRRSSWAPLAVLALIVAIYRNRGDVYVDNLNILKW